MGCYTTSVADYENCGAPALGLQSYTSGPFDQLYAVVSARNTPASAPKTFALVCEANLRARGLLYWKRNPGDCPAPTGVSGITSGQIVGLSGQAASGVVGGFGAAGVLTGPATFGIGTAISFAVAGIEGIFAHHAQAVQQEQSTICAVAGYFNPLVKQIDAMVADGAITPAQGVSYLRQVAQQAINGLVSIQKTCNAACVYTAILKAHIDFASSYYPAIAPAAGISAAAPGAAPSAYGSLPGGVLAGSNQYGNVGAAPPTRSTLGNTYAPALPGSAPDMLPNYVLPSGNTCSSPGIGPGCAPDYLNRGYNQQTGQSGQYADVPSTINWAMWGAIAAVIAAIVAVLALVL